MRIITGSARGVALKTLEGEATRPTSEKVKEAVFSALQFDLEGRRFLDLFAGSGQMGLEALSRGAAHATFIDASREAMEVVKANAKKTGLFHRAHFLVSDFRSYLRKAKGGDGFHVVFIDPPYAERLSGECVKRLLECGLLSPHALVVTESEEEEIFAAFPEAENAFEIVKKKKYGRTWIHILRLKDEATE